MGSDVLAVGAIPSPRLCKLGLPHLPVGGVAQEASPRSWELALTILVRWQWGLRRYGGVC
jgi:hypothetical protein